MRRGSRPRERAGKKIRTSMLPEKIGKKSEAILSGGSSVKVKGRGGRRDRMSNLPGGKKRARQWVGVMATSGHLFKGQ